MTEADGVWHWHDETSLTAVAPRRTDLFIDPAGAPPTLNAPRTQDRPGPGDFQVSARFRVGFASAFDAAGFVAWYTDTCWAKFCFEYSPQGEGMIVSVITRGVSDDANGFVVEGPEAWLRVSRIGAAFAFHASTDGARWHFIRHFRLDPPPDVELTLSYLVQSPTGEGCEAFIDQLAWDSTTLADLRDGS